MKVFIAGGSGAIGKRLVPQLVANGYDVMAMTRSPGKSSALSELGAEVAIADALDRRAVLDAVTNAQPDVIVHQLTALEGVNNLKRFDREFALTNRLRTEGTEHLLQAARAVGARRFIAQSFGGWNYERAGNELKTEDDRLDPHPPAAQLQSLEAIRELEARVLAFGGIALR